MECFWYNYTIINCLLTIFVHNYYAKPIYYTAVSKWCESLADWSIPLNNPVVTLHTCRKSPETKRHFLYGHSPLASLWMDSVMFVSIQQWLFIKPSVPITLSVCFELKTAFVVQSSAGTRRALFIAYCILMLCHL